MREQTTIHKVVGTQRGNKVSSKTEGVIKSEFDVDGNLLRGPIVPKDYESIGRFPKSFENS